MHREQLIQEVTKGDQSATDFLLMIHDVAHVWDDLIDRDLDVAPSAINAAFFAALIGIPNNAFYRRHIDQLQPLVMSSVTNWLVANQLEATDSESDKHIAFITRSGYVDLFLYVAALIGGPAWAVEVGAKVRRFVHAEGIETYLSNLAAEKAAREGE